MSTGTGRRAAMALPDDEGSTFSFPAEVTIVFLCFVASLLESFFLLVPFLFSRWQQKLEVLDARVFAYGYAVELYLEDGSTLLIC